MYLSMLMTLNINFIGNNYEDCLKITLKNIQNYVFQKTNNWNLRRSRITADDILGKNYEFFL